MDVDYGIDSPEDFSTMLWRGGTFLALGIGVWYMNRAEHPEPSMNLLLVLGAIGVVFFGLAAYLRWSSKTGKIQLRDEILDSFAWTGDEKVLDVGCGRGLMLIGAAKKLRKGKATGIDIWDPNGLSGNKPEAALENAKAEGVSDRVKIENGDAMRLSYPAGSYDVVLSSSVLHSIPDAPEREQALSEMYRVTKPGGRIAIFDVYHAGDYATYLQGLGLQEVKVSGLKWLWGVPGRIVQGVKPVTA